MQRVISGLTLSNFRKANNLTIPAMAAFAGVPEATIRDFEDDTRSMTAAMFERVKTKVLGAPSAPTSITIDRSSRRYRGCCGS